jgi:hypothetical protein
MTLLLGFRYCLLENETAVGGEGRNSLHYKVKPVLDHLEAMWRQDGLRVKL